MPKKTAEEVETANVAGWVVRSAATPTETTVRLFNAQGKEVFSGIWPRQERISDVAAAVYSMIPGVRVCDAWQGAKEVVDVEDLV